MRCFTLTAVIFLSTPSARRATRAGLPESAGRKDFYPRPPRGGRLVRFNKRLRKKQISIHALREEGDSGWRPRPPWRCNFYPRPPRGGRPEARRLEVMEDELFLSTPSARRATAVGLAHPQPRILISIHALREEGDRRWRRHLQGPTRFLSTPSARRATRGSRHVRCKEQISIHALREEGDAVRPPFFASCF